MKTSDIILRPTHLNDLETLFVFQLDEEANYLAAFTPEDPSDKAAYLKKWSRLLENSKINMQTILLKDTIVGSITKFEMDGDAEITYWIDKDFWGKGIATLALKQFLEIETTRPIFGRVAFDNYGSKKVLEHCGFRPTGIEKGFANARQEEIEESIYKLL